MLKIEGLKLAPGESEALLYERAAAALRVKAPLHTLHILRRSIDARDGVTFIYTVSAALENEERVLRRARNKSVSVYAPAFYELPPMIAPPAVRPVVIGAGRRDCSRRWCSPAAARGPSCSSAANASSGDGATSSASGRRAS